MTSFIFLSRSSLKYFAYRFRYEVGYGIASVNNSATGVYEVTLDLDSNPANTVVTITPFTIGFGIPEIAGYETTGANTFIVRIQDASGTARDSAFTFVVYGN